ncbi:MAG: sodium-dependent transporter, partial [Bilophila sp.]
MATTPLTRDLFVSRLGILAATLGSAVGLGNIWKFPALTGQNGGASFLLVYICAALLVGLPVLIMELAMGRSQRANPVTAFRKMSPTGYWWLIGVSGVVAAVLILGFYTEVVGWVLAYIASSCTGATTTTDPAVAKKLFQSLIANPWQSVLWQWVVFVIVAAVILRGASRGIERITRILMPLLFLLLVVVCIRSLTLPGAVEGLRFLFMPDFSRIDGSVILMALGLAFFKLSIGMGVMLTYGSYFRSDVNIPVMALRVVLLDLLISLLAGVAIFPAVFAFGFEPTAGPSLLFLTIPAVFASMPGGQAFTVIFFVLSAVAATGAMLSLLEAPVVWLSETFKLDRRRATLFATLFFAAFGVPAALSAGVMSDVTLFGKTFFDLYDFISSNILMPVGGMMLCVFAGHFWGDANALKALSNDGALNNEGIVRAVLLLCRWVSPVLIFVILLKG